MFWNHQIYAYWANSLCICYTQRQQSLHSYPVNHSHLQLLTIKNVKKNKTFCKDIDLFSNIFVEVLSYILNPQWHKPRRQAVTSG